MKQRRRKKRRGLEDKEDQGRRVLEKSIKNLFTRHYANDSTGIFSLNAFKYSNLVITVDLSMFPETEP